MPRRQVFGLFLAFLALAWEKPVLAQSTARWGHSTTLLPNGNILIVGGALDGAGTVFTTSVEIFVAASGTLVPGAALPIVARASHTATLLPNGNVLIAGGFNAGGPLGDAAVYNPDANTWSAAIPMNSNHGNHTATLLPNGRVLIAGGESAAGTVTNLCELFTPAGLGGAFALTGPLGQGRAAHSATLLPNNKVFVAGGYVAGGGNVSYLGTTELYDFNTQLWIPGATLIDSRAYHTATMLGNQTVLIIGGFNGKDFQGNLGILQSAEIYNPISDSIQTAGQMQVRNMLYTSVLMPDGAISMLGGLGNITTTYVTNTVNFQAQNINMSPPGDCSSPGPGGFSCLVDNQVNVTTGTIQATSDLRFKYDINLSRPVDGHIVQGDIFFSSPSVSLTDATVVFTNPGTRASLNGVRIGAHLPPPDGPVAPGRLLYQLSLTNPSGLIIFKPQFVTAVDQLGGGVSGTLNGCGVIGQGQNGVIGPGSFVQFQVDAPMPGSDLNGTVQSMCGLVLNTNPPGKSAMTATQGNTFTANITTGSVSNTGTPCAGALPVSLNTGGSPHWVSNGSLRFDNITGSITNNSAGPISCPLSLAAANLTGIQLRFTYVVSPVDLGGQTFSFDIATVTIRQMVFSDREDYDPTQNQWAFAGDRPATPFFQHTSVLLPNGDITFFGGRECNDALTNCSGFSPLTGPGAYILKQGGGGSVSWTPQGNLNAARANHTTTVLPGGQVLTAGGNNGASVLQSAELYNLQTRTWSQTGPMVRARDHHTATLLPNGTVLVTGGFTTQNGSSSTSHAEIYYPNSGTWVATTPMISSRSYHTATLLQDGTVLVTGGFQAGLLGGQYLNTAEVYYSTSHVWVQVPNLVTARAQHTATLLQNGQVLLTGGVNNGGVIQAASNNVEVFNNPLAPGGFTAAPAAVSQLPTVPTNQARYAHTATLLSDGRVLVAGGDDGFGEISKAIIYDPNALTWTPTIACPPICGNDLEIARLRHTAILLPNNKVLIVGGVTALGQAINSTEGFDVSFSSWQPQGLSNIQRGYHTTVLLPDGNVLNTGGLGGTSGAQYLNQAETQYFSFIPDVRTPGGTQRQPQLVSVTTTTFDRGNSVTLFGSRFKGVSEASGGGSGPQNSSFFHPRIVFQRLDSSGGTNAESAPPFLLDLSSRAYASGLNTSWSQMDSSITIPMPAVAGLLPYGWYHFRVASNAQFSSAQPVQAGPPLPTGAPGIPSPTSVFISSIVWSWAPAPPTPITPDGYDIYSATNNVFLGTAPFTASPSFIQTGIGPNSAASIEVAAFTLSGDGPFTVSTVTIITPSANINNLSGFAISVATINWAWNPVGTATSYNVYSSSSGGLLAAIVGSANSFFTETNLATNTAYGIQVQAITPGGTGLLSGAVTTYTLAAPPVPASPPYINITSASYQANWLTNTNPPYTLYRVQVSSAANGPVLQSFSNLTTSSVSVNGLIPNTLYITSVTAINGDGRATNYVSLGNVITLAAAPTNLTAVGFDPSTVQLAWTSQNPSYTPFQVLYSSDNFVTVVSTAIPFPTPPSFTAPPGFGGTSTQVGGLQTAVNYFFQVCAENQIGLVACAPVVQATTSNGGGPLGSLTIIVTHNQNTNVTGTIASGRTIGVNAPFNTFDPQSVTLIISSYGPAGLPCGPINAAIQILAVPPVQPIHPFQLSMSFSPTEPGITNLSTLALVRYDASSNTCVPLTSKVDTGFSPNRITAQVNHLSIFQLQQISPATSLSTARIFPNPLYSSSQGYFTFDTLPAGTRIRIYTLHGEALFDGTTNNSGMLSWNATNKVQRPVASGVYLVLLESGGDKRILKIAVVR